MALSKPSYHDVISQYIGDEATSMISSSMEGMAKALLLGIVPMSILSRRVKNVRRSVALAAFVGIVRALSRLQNELDLVGQDQEEESSSTVQEDFRRRSAWVVYLHRWISSWSRMQRPLIPIGGFFGFLAAWAINKGVDSYFVFWILMRSIHSFRWFNVPYGYVPLMCIASDVLGSWWLAARDEINPSYLKMIDYMAQLPNASERASNVLKLNDPCCGLHPEDPRCLRFYAGKWATSFPLNVRLYLSFYGLFHLVRIIRSPAPLQVICSSRLWLSLAKSVLQSSIFLSCFGVGGPLSSCLWNNTVWRIPLVRRIYGGRISRWTALSHIWITGFLIFLERPSRRAELTVYTMGHLGDCLWRTLTHGRYAPPYPTAILALIGALGMAGLVHNHHTQPNLFSRWLLGMYKQTDRTQTIRNKRIRKFEGEEGESDANMVRT